MLRQLQFKTSAFTGTTQRETVGQGLAKLVATSLAGVGKYADIKKEEDDLAIQDNLYNLNTYINNEKSRINKIENENDKAIELDKLYSLIDDSDTGLLASEDGSISVDLEILRNNKQSLSKVSGLLESLSSESSRYKKSYTLDNNQEQDVILSGDLSLKYNNMINSEEFTSASNSDKLKMSQDFIKNNDIGNIHKSAVTDDGRRTLVSFTNKINSNNAIYRANANIDLSYKKLDEVVNIMDSSNFDDNFKLIKSLNPKFTKKEYVNAWANNVLKNIDNNTDIKSISDFSKKYSAYTQIKDRTVRKVIEKEVKRVSFNNLTNDTVKSIFDEKSEDTALELNQLDSIGSEVYGSEYSGKIKKEVSKKADTLFNAILSANIEPKEKANKLGSMFQRASSLGVRIKTVDTMLDGIFNREISDYTSVKKAIDMVNLGVTNGYIFDSKKTEKLRAIDILARSYGLREDDGTLTKDELEANKIFAVKANAIVSGEQKTRPNSSIITDSIEELNDGIGWSSNYTDDEIRIARESANVIYSYSASDDKNKELYKDILEQELEFVKSQSSDDLPFFNDIKKKYGKDVELSDIEEHLDRTKGTDDSSITFFSKTIDGDIIYNHQFTDRLGKTVNKKIFKKDLENIVGDVSRIGTGRGIITTKEAFEKSDLWKRTVDYFGDKFKVAKEKREQEADDINNKNASIQELGLIHSNLDVFGALSGISKVGETIANAPKIAYASLLNMQIKRVNPKLFNGIKLKNYSNITGKTKKLDIEKVISKINKQPIEEAKKFKKVWSDNITMIEDNAIRIFNKTHNVKMNTGNINELSNAIDEVHRFRTIFGSKKVNINPFNTKKTFDDLEALGDPKVLDNLYAYMEIMRRKGKISGDGRNELLDSLYRYMDKIENKYFNGRVTADKLEKMNSDMYDFRKIDKAKKILEGN